MGVLGLNTDIALIIVLVVAYCISTMTYDPKVNPLMAYFKTNVVTPVVVWSVIMLLFRFVCPLPVYTDSKPATGGFFGGGGCDDEMMGGAYSGSVLSNVRY